MSAIAASAYEGRNTLRAVNEADLLREVLIREVRALGTMYAVGSHDAGSVRIALHHLCTHVQETFDTGLRCYNQIKAQRDTLAAAVARNTVAAPEVEGDGTPEGGTPA